MDPGKRGPAARPSTAVRPSRSPAVMGVVLILLALLTARLGPGIFCAFVALVTALGALELATALKRQGASLKPLVAAAGGAAFPIGVHLWGELAILAVAALVFIAFAGGLALRGLRPGAVRTLAALLLPAIYVGLAGSFLVLVRRNPDGTAMLEVFLGMIVVYRLGFWVGSRQAGADSGMPIMVGAGAGALACVVTSLFLGLLLDHRPGMGAMLGIGLFVGLAAAVGTLGGALLSRHGKPGAKAPPRPVLRQIEAALLAAPAFFYAFRLLLT